MTRFPRWLVAAAAAVLALLIAAAVPATAASSGSVDSSLVRARLRAVIDSLRTLGIAQDTSFIQDNPLAPPGRYIHSTVFDPVRNRLLVFGGVSSAGVNGDVWQMPLAGSPTWSALNVPGGPTARGGQVAIYDAVGDRLIVFGGYDTDRRNDVWALSLSGTPAWTQLSPAGTPPSPRSLHAAVYDPVRNRMIVFGGYENSGYLNDTWALSLSGTPTWTRLQPNGPLPSARREHTVIYDPVRDRVIVFAGSPTASNDTWALSLSGTPAWSQIATFGAAPPARYGQAAIYDPPNDRMLVYGGTSGTGYYSDLWALSLAADTWSEVQTAGAIAGRTLTPAAYDPGTRRMFVFSGWNSGFLQDLEALALSGTPTWSEVVPGGAPGGGPTARYTHMAIADPPRDRMVVFGGILNNGAADNQTYALTLSAVSSWSAILATTPPAPRASGTSVFDPIRNRMIVFGGYSNGSRLNDTWTLDLSGTAQWSPLTVSGSPPTVRNLHSAIYDPVRDRMIVFGGYDGGNYRDDVWALSLSGTVTWTKLTPAGTPPPAMREHSAIYDPARDRMLVFGGEVTGGNPLNTVWALSLGASPAWSIVDATNPPGARMGHTAVYEPTHDRMIVFGGYGGGYANDTWALDLATSTWTRMTPDGSPPAGRLLHTAVWDASRSVMIVYGGINNVGAFNDTWLLALSGVPTWYPPGSPAPPPPTTPLPAFTVVPAVPPTLRVGQSLTLLTTVRNDGLASNDGRIVFSFPQLDAPDDGDRVTSGSTGDAPGFTLVARGATTVDNACQPRTASYLVASYEDDDWSGTEANTLSLTITPRQTGTFTILCRASLAATDQPCQWSTVTPAGGPADVDQQGFTVTRYTVTVLPPPSDPEPAFTAAVSGIPNSITLGERFTVTCSVRNDGITSDDGAIVCSFPSLTGAGDGQWVTSTTSGDSPGFRNLPAGSALADVSCAPVTGTYLVSEYRDNAWDGAGAEVNTASFTIEPTSSGVFTFDVRATMHTTGAACLWWNALPANGASGFVDPQGWPVKRFSVTVNPVTPPAPVFVSVSGIPSTVVLGETFTMTVSVKNSGGASDDGRIAVAFPSLTDPSDGVWVEPAGATDTDAPGYVETPAGGSLPSATCQPIPASYLATEWTDNAWASNETNNLALTVRPQATGVFYVDVRSTMHRMHGVTCDYFGAVPSVGSTAIDQQGRTVTRYAIFVAAPPPPPGPPSMHWARMSTSGAPPSARYGQSAVYDAGRDQMVIAAGNWGDCSTDAYALALASGSWLRFPDMLQHSDERVHHTAIYDPVAQRVMVFGGECLALINDVQSLYLMNGAYWYRSAPAGTRPSPREGMAAVFDPVRRRMLMIGGFDGGFQGDVWELSMADDNGAWSKLEVGGPPMPGREGHSAIYDPVRDRIVVYGGNAGEARFDVWALSLSGTPAWTELTPTGTPPSPRWRHSAIYDPAGDRMVVFGGAASQRLSDVWALALSGTPTWTQLFSSTTGPAARYGHSAVYDAARGQMVMFGGEIGPRAYSNEVWTLTFDAPTATVVSLVGAEADAERVRLVWDVVGDRSDATVYRRSEPAAGWEVLGAPSAEGGHLVFEDRAIAPGSRYAYRLGVAGADGEVFSAPIWVTVPVRSVFALGGARAIDGRIEVRFSLSDDAPVSLVVYDLAGRLRAQREVGALGAGEHAVTLGETLPAGVYLIRLTGHGEALRAKTALWR